MCNPFVCCFERTLFTAAARNCFILCNNNSTLVAWQWCHLYWITACSNPVFGACVSPVNCWGEWAIQQIPSSEHLAYMSRVFLWSNSQTGQLSGLFLAIFHQLFFFHSASLSVTRHSESKWHKRRPRLSPCTRCRRKQISDGNIHEHEAENPLRSHTDNQPGYPTQQGFWEAGGGGICPRTYWLCASPVWIALHSLHKIKW